MSSQPQSSDIQKDVEASRQRVDSALSDIEEKFSPGRLFDRASGYMRDNSDEIAEFGRNIGRTVRDHPIPVLLTGVGLASLAVASMRGTDHRDRYRDQAWTGEGMYYGDGADEGTHLRDKAAAVVDKARSAGESARDRYRSAREGASRRYAMAGDRIGSAYERQPLVCGAVAAALGMTLAALLPATRREDELMGRQRDQLRDDAKDKIAEGKREAEEALRAGPERESGAF